MMQKNVLAFMFVVDVEGEECFNKLCHFHWTNRACVMFTINRAHAMFIKVQW